MDYKKTDIALGELKQQHDICELHCMQNSGWNATTGNLISKYTGEDSEFYREYVSWRGARNAWGYDDLFAGQQQVRAKLLLAHVMQHIERNGLYTPPPKRIFDNLPDWQTVLAMVSIGGIIFAGGYKTGDVFEAKSATKDQLKVEAELDSFKKGLKFLPSISSDSSHEKPKIKK